MDNNSHEISLISQCKLIKLAKHHHENGNLSVVESNNELPFNIRRVYYLYDVPGGEERGGHSHHKCYEFIIAVSGSFDIIIDDGLNSQIISLNRSDTGLLVVPGIWRVLNNFSSGSVCLVIASEGFEESDYVRDKDEFIRLTSQKKEFNL